MDLKDIIPNSGVQRAYCAQCKGPLDLVFRRFREEVSGVEIDIEGLPMLWCESCHFTALPDRTRAALVRTHLMATRAEQTRFESRRRKIEKDFGFTSVPFEYDADDYFYYPGLERPFEVGFLTPVFFNRRVLSKYDADPNYAIRFASPTYGDILADGFTIPFGVNKHGHLLMWLGDIAKLPMSEQYYLMSENRPSDHSIGSEFYDGQIECVFTPPSAERELFAARSDFLEASFKRFGVKLAHLDDEVLDTASSLIRPVIDGNRQRRDVADALNKIHLESLDNRALDALASKLSVTSKGSGSLKRLQAILESIDRTEGVNGLLSPFYTLYDLRVAYSHLTSASKAKELLKSVTARLALPDDADLMQIYDRIVGELTRSYAALKAIVAP